PFRRSAVFTTATSGAQPEFVYSPTQEDRCASHRAYLRMDPPRAFTSSELGYKRPSRTVPPRLASDLPPLSIYDPHPPTQILPHPAGFTIPTIAPTFQFAPDPHPRK